VSGIGLTAVSVSLIIITSVFFIVKSGKGFSHEVADDVCDGDPDNGYMSGEEISEQHASRERGQNDMDALSNDHRLSLSASSSGMFALSVTQKLQGRACPLPTIWRQCLQQLNLFILRPPKEP